VPGCVRSQRQRPAGALANQIGHHVCHGGAVPRQPTAAVVLPQEGLGRRAARADVAGQVPGGGGAPGEVTGFFLDITSDDKDRMLAFYRDIVGLEPFPAVGPYGLKVSDGALLHFDTHSDTRGPAKEPGRVLIDFFVEDVKAERERLEAAGVRFFRKEGIEFWGGIISSFLDPDGNIVQLCGYDPALDTTRNAQG